MSKLSILTNGWIKENPTLVMVLGTCPALAVTTSVENAIGMGAATTFVLTLSNILVSMLKNVAHNKVRIPVFIVVIASFTTIVDLLMQAYAPRALVSNLGIFIPLIVVNCIILGRAEAFACKNNIFNSLLDGLGMGIGFTFALVLIAICREIIGNGTILGFTLFSGKEILLLVLPPGAFLVMGFIIALIKIVRNKNN